MPLTTCTRRARLKCLVQFVVREAIRRMMDVFSLKAASLPAFDVPEGAAAAVDAEDDEEPAPLRYAWTEPAHNAHNTRVIKLVTEYVENHGTVICSAARVPLKILQRDGVQKLVIKQFDQLSKNFADHQLVTARSQRLERELLAGIAQAAGAAAEDDMQIDEDDLKAQEAAAQKKDKTKTRSKTQMRKKRVSPDAVPWGH